MRTTQVSAFIENRPDPLLYLLNVLAEAQVNLVAHNIVDASDFGIVHVIVDNPDKAIRAIRDAGMTCSATTVLEIAVSNEPGSLVDDVLIPLADRGVNIEYSYAFSSPTSGNASVVLKVSDLDRAEEALNQ